MDFKEKWKGLEKRVADLEKAQNQPIKVDANLIYRICKEENEREMKKSGSIAGL